VSSADKPLVICLMGPTASGKTDLAIALAGVMECELISVDSALVYRGLNIGSAKPDYPHHLVDIRDPAEAYNAADFISDANAACEEIISRGKTPLLVGGTMLYFKAFLEGLAEMPPADPKVREAIYTMAAKHGWPAVHAQLAAVDPTAAGRIHPNHSQRLSRALEVYQISGVTMTQWQLKQAAQAGQLPGDRYCIRQLAICPADRKQLHRRIELRFAQMMQAGFVEEVSRLRQRSDLHRDLPAIRAVGYRQLWDCLEGNCSLSEAEQRGVAATRQLAKRQLTWLRKWSELAWIYTDNEGNVCESVGILGPSEHLGQYSSTTLALKYLKPTIPIT